MPPTHFTLFAMLDDLSFAKGMVAWYLPDGEDTTDGEKWKVSAVDAGTVPERTLTIVHDPAYAREPNWSRQKQGMAGFFSQGEPSERQQAVVQSLIPNLAFCLAFTMDSPPDAPDHPWYELLFTLARTMNGVVFTGDRFLDCERRTILEAYGDFDPDATLPGDAESEEVEHTEPEPPSEDAVKKQTLVLAALVGRGLIERDHLTMNDPVALHQRLHRWTKETGAWDTLDEDETRLMQAPPGTLTQQEAINLIWRVEGLEVLVWALQLKDLPAWDEISDVDSVLNATGFLGHDRTVEGALRPLEELHSLRARTFAVHWRIRDWSLAPKRRNFREFADEGWFGPLDIAGLHLIDDDLAVQGMPIDQADPDTMSTAASICQERHKAINWLTTGGIYAETDTST